MKDNDDNSEQATGPEMALADNQVRLERRMKMKEYCATYRSKINSVVEGENPTHSLGLPDETWEHVLSNLDDLTDVQNCFNTCQQFRASLSPSQKTLLQLKKVLPILLRLRYINLDSIFVLRLVSKDVCQLVNNYLESKKSWINYDVALIVYALIPSIYNFVKLRMRFKVGRTAKAKALVRKSILNDINSANPLLSRFLIIYGDTSSREVAHGNIINFLEEWGGQIWYLELLKTCTTGDFLEILRLLPNLKYLRLCGKITEGGENLQDNYSALLKEACPKLTSMVISVSKNDVAPVYDNLYEVFATQLENKW